MKIGKICIVVIAVLAATSGIMSCNQHGGILASVAVTPVIQSMANGTTQQFVATATFSDGTILYWSRVVKWSSSNDAVATVDNTTGYNGLVTSKSTGTAIITAYDVANNITGTAALTVTDPVSIEITPANPVVTIGTAIQLAAKGTFPDNTTQSLLTVSVGAAQVLTWTSSDSGIAACGSNNGLVTSGSITGFTTISAVYTIGSVSLSDSTTLTVTQTPLASIAITPLTPGIPGGGVKQQFTATGTYADGSTLDLTSSVTWISSDITIATISNVKGSRGLATSSAAGAVTITATDPVTNIAGATTLTVTAN